MGGRGEVQWRDALESDVGFLARGHRCLQEDEGHPAPMGLEEAEERIRGWLSGEYRVVVFFEGEAPVGYAVCKPEGGGTVLLRQLFVGREHRRRGVGRRAFERLVGEIVPAGARLVVNVLASNERALAFWGAVGFSEYVRTLERKGAVEGGSQGSS